MNKGDPEEAGSRKGDTSNKKKKLVEFMNLLLKIFESIQIGILRIINVKN